MFYLDSCVLVSALTKEARTPDIIEWLGRNHRFGFAYSEWVSTEFSAALSVKRRKKEIEANLQTEALALYANIVGNSFERLTISDNDFKEASRLAENHKTGIRAGDALHLAICLHAGRVKLCTLDDRLSKAGPQLGVETLLL